jgi:hypothetical protein
MNEAETFETYLNLERPDLDTILTAGRFVANKWADYRTHEKILIALEAEVSDKDELRDEIAALDGNPEFLERAALAVLSLTWGHDRALVEAAFEEAEGALVTTKVTVLGTAALLVIALWIWKSNAGELSYHTKTVRNSDGSYAMEETVERQPFPFDVISIIRALRGSEPSDDPAFRPSKHQVQLAQKTLVAAGYRIAVDGEEGSETDAAVSKYQQAHHLASTGRIDRPTLIKMGVEP